MKVRCTNIGIQDENGNFSGQTEWSGVATEFTRAIDQRIRVANLQQEDGSWRTENRETDAGHIFVYEVTDEDRRALAYKKITEFYPEWKQLNIIQTGGEELTKMNTFIQSVRDWSNTNSNDPFGLENYTP